MATKRIGNAFFEGASGTTYKFAAFEPDSDRPPVGGVVLVAESGIEDSASIARLERAGANAFLVGESLMRETDIGLALERLRRTQ